MLKSINTTDTVSDENLTYAIDSECISLQKQAATYNVSTIIVFSNDG